MKFAYADPPYLGCGAYYAKHHPDALIWNDPETHRSLIERLSAEYPDGWALSLHAPSLHTLLAMCPNDVRIGAYCKPFVAGIGKKRVQFMWEPLIWRGGRRPNAGDMVKDWIVAWPRSGARDGLIGGKPRDVCRWVFSLLGATRGDQFDDLFPGTGAVSAAWAEWIGEKSPMGLTPLEEWAGTTEGLV